MRDALYEEACDGVNKEIQDLCSIGEPSLLRATSAEDWLAKHGRRLIMNLRTEPLDSTSS